MENESKYIQVLAAVAGSFGANLDDATCDFWLDMLKEDEISILQFQAAAKEIIRTRKYKGMPNYAEFLDHCKGNIRDIALMQADEVMNQVKRLGHGIEPEFDDPVTQHLMTHIRNWKTFCLTLLEKNVPFFIRDFIEQYQAYAKSYKRKEIEMLEAPEKIKQLTRGIG